MLEHILTGGPMMVPLMICSLISLAVVVDRFLAFRANAKVDTRALEANVLAMLRSGDVEAAIAECEATRGPVATVLLAGLCSYRQLRDKGESSETMRMVIGEVMTEQTSQAMGSVTKRFDVLTTIGTTAPLLGMTGTVTGMIASFQGLAEGAGGSDGNTAVADGIAEALVTTAAGLIIALMAVIPESIFNRWGDNIELEIDDFISDFMEFILTHH
jgi:biopolymer transport protein ExbB